MKENTTTFTGGRISTPIADRFRKAAADSGWAAAKQFVHALKNALPTHACAWCAADGNVTLYSLDCRTVWRSLPAGCAMPQSHGICPSCFRREMGRELTLADAHVGAPATPIEWVIIR